MTNRKQTKPIVWIDTDGVLAIYEKQAYQGNEPVYQKPKYFQHVQPDMRMMNAIWHLKQNKIDIRVLTNINASEQPEIIKQIKHDKTIWLNRYLQKHHIPHEIITIPKWKHVEATLKRPLAATDILISDYNNDLIPWQEHGGTAMKYLNGLNSPRETLDFHINEDADTKLICEKIQALSYLLTY